MKRYSILFLGILISLTLLAFVTPSSLKEDYCLKTPSGPNSTGICTTVLSDVPSEHEEHEGELVDVLRCNFNVDPTIPESQYNCSGNGLGPVFH